MKVESSVANKQVTLILIPENPLEEEILKQVATQKNSVVQLDTLSGMSTGTRMVKNGVVIGEGLQVATSVNDKSSSQT